MSHYAIEVFVHYFRQRKFPPKQRYLANRSLDCIEQTNEQCKKNANHTTREKYRVQVEKQENSKTMNMHREQEFICVISFALFRHFLPYSAIDSGM